MKFGVLYCFWDNHNPIKDIEIVEARSISLAFRKTERNLEENIIIPINKKNINQLTRLVKQMKNSCTKRL